MALQLKETGILSNITPLEKLEIELTNEYTKIVYEEILEGLIEIDEPQIRDAIERIKPDVILLDHMFAVPSIYKGVIPWVMLYSVNPLEVFHSPNLPPPYLGLPTNNPSLWNDYRKVSEEINVMFGTYQNRILEHFGYDKEEPKYICSLYLNIYGFPAELDYTDVATIPDNFVQIDAFSRKIPEPFEFPEEFRSKINPGDKLVYISMGSMGSVDVELMQKIVGTLKDTRHKYVVSKGPLGDEYELPDNMWGENYLPQTNILPLVDLVITHGGNNTFTETFICGKPMIVMPLFWDQYDNAQRVHEKGYGVRIEPFNFEPSQLIEAVDRLLDDQAIKEKAKKAAQRIAQSNSKERACIAIEQLAIKYPSK